MVEILNLGTCYFGKQNSTLGSVVPLAMFKERAGIPVSHHIFGVSVIWLNVVRVGKMLCIAILV